VSCFEPSHGTWHGQRVRGERAAPAYTQIGLGEAGVPRLRMGMQ
jgi:hypothetical protein